MLTERQLRFANEYLVDSNAQQAALRAGYALETARTKAYAMLEKPEIMNYIELQRQQLESDMQVTHERVLAEYARMAFANAGRLFDAAGNLLPVQQIPDDMMAAVAAMECTQLKNGNTVVKIKLSDKRAALDSICRMMGYNAPDKKEGDLVVYWQDNTGGR